MEHSFSDNPIPDQIAFGDDDPRLGAAHRQIAARHRQVWQIYVAEIRSALAPRLTTDEAYALTRMLNRLYD